MRSLSEYMLVLEARSSQYWLEGQVEEEMVEWNILSLQATVQGQLLMSQKESETLGAVGRTHLSRVSNSFMV